jgi:TonB-linked SusC/RagA family outer membrane protein
LDLMKCVFVTTNKNMKVKFTEEVPLMSIWKISLLISLMCLIGFQNDLYGQQKTIKGIVYDDTGIELPGANVLVKGTTRGTITGLDGVFTIEVAPGENVLVVSYVGYETKEINVGNQSEIKVILAESLQLSEIVITAAGIERNANTLGYSVTTLNSDKITQINEPDAVRALTGKIAGVNIQSSGGVAGGATNITIRGNSSLGNNNQPLFVVDGVPFDNSTFEQTGSRQTQSNQSTPSRAFDIDPNNIESLTVLKGAAAAALYGSRAANGAIIITTKSGSQVRKGMEVTFRSSFSFEEISGLPEYQTRFGQGTSGDYRPGVFGSYGSAYTSRPTIPHPLASMVNYSAFPQFFEADGSTPIQVPYQNYSGENQRNFFKTGYLSENGISINAGTEKAGLVVGFSNARNKGVVPNNEVSRTSFNLGGNANLDNGLYIRGTLSYVRTEQQAPPMGGSGSVMNALLYMPSSYDLTNFPYEHPETGESIYYRGALDNPYWSVNNSLSTSTVDRYFGSFVVGKDITPWLNIQNTFGFNGYTDRRVSVLGKGSSVYANGTINTDNISRQELDNNLLATMNFALTPDLKLRAIVGNNINQRTTDRSAFSGDGIIVRGIDDIRNTTTITLSNIPNNQAFIQQRYYAFFGDLTFDYKDYVSLNFVGRNDVSSTLPAESRNYLYGGVNGSFIFTEAFNLQNSALNFGSIRMGYTKVGNEANPYQTINVFNANSNYGGLGAPFSNANNSNVSTQTLSTLLTNSTLQPEFITEYEVGTELRFLQNLFVIDFTYYNKLSTSQVFVVNAAPSSGFLSRIINLGETRNRGIEIGFTANPLISERGLNWTINANFTRNRNLVMDIGSFAQLSYGGNVHIAGQPYGQILGTAFARDDDGNVLVNPNTAKPLASAVDQSIGDPNPDFFAGLSNRLSWRGITLDVLFDWKQGGNILSTTIGQIYARGIIKDSEDRIAHRVFQGVLGDASTRTPLLDKNGNSIPNNTAIGYNDYFFSSGFGPGGISEANIFDATVFRLREISLGYTIPKNLLTRTPFGSAFISVSGRNLWYLAPNAPKYMNYDPELSTQGANNMGYDQLGVPATRRYGVNLSVNF